LGFPIEADRDRPHRVGYRWAIPIRLQLAERTRALALFNLTEGKAMQSIPVGATGSFSLVVMPDHLASRFKDVTSLPLSLPQNDRSGIWPDTGNNEEAICLVPALLRRVRVR